MNRCYWCKFHFNSAAPITSTDATINAKVYVCSDCQEDITLAEKFVTTGLWPESFTCTESHVRTTYKNIKDSVLNAPAEDPDKMLTPKHVEIKLVTYGCTRDDINDVFSGIAIVESDRTFCCLQHPEHCEWSITISKWLRDSMKCKQFLNILTEYKQVPIQIRNGKVGLVVISNNRYW